MHLRALKVEFLEDVVVQVTYQDGKVIRYDMSQMFEKYPQLEELRRNRKLFESGHLDLTGFAVIWNEELDFDATSIYVSGKYKNQEIFIEFGPYTNNGKGPTYCHYYYKNAGGLRFSKTTFNYWSNNIVDDYIKVSNNRDMTVGELLNQVTSKYCFSANNYRVYGENDNYFVGECVTVMHAKRFKGRDFRGNHTMSISIIPVKILDALEDNEKDILPNVSKVPIIGGIADFFDLLIN